MAYRKTARTEARKADNRRRLLEVARKLVADGGFEAVQISTVASLAGVATGTVYRYFPSKADLCAEVFRHVSGREIEVAAEIAGSGGPAPERLAAAIRAVTSRAIRGRKTAYALIAEPVDPAIDSERLVHRRALCRVFESILTDGVAAGEFAPQNVETSAACIVGAFMEALVSPLAPGSAAVDHQAESILASVTEFCHRAVAKQDGDVPRARD